jgi:hypothetical protein
MANERSSGGAGQARSPVARAPISEPESEVRTPTEASVNAAPSSPYREERPRPTGGERRGILDQAREGAMHRLDRQKERATTGLSSLVDAIRQGGRQLQGENSTVASYVDSAAGQMERVIDGLRTRNVGQMVTDIERFAKRRPGVFLGSAFVLGFVTARFLKSSTPASASLTYPQSEGGGYGQNY